MSFNLFQKIVQVVITILASAMRDSSQRIHIRAQINSNFKCSFRLQMNNPNILLNIRSTKITVISGK